MTNTNTASNNEKQNRTPSHLAYQVTDRENQKSIWTRVGSAWAHGDGKGFNIQLDALPLDGRISLRVYEDRKDQPA